MRNRLQRSTSFCKSPPDDIEFQKNCWYRWVKVSHKRKKTCFKTSDKDGNMGSLIRDVSPSQGLRDWRSPWEGETSLIKLPIFPSLSNVLKVSQYESSSTSIVRMIMLAEKTKSWAMLTLKRMIEKHLSSIARCTLTVGGRKEARWMLRKWPEKHCFVRYMYHVYPRGGAEILSAKAKCRECEGHITLSCCLTAMDRVHPASSFLSNWMYVLPG